MSWKDISFMVIWMDLSLRNIRNMDPYPYILPVPLNIPFIRLLVLSSMHWSVHGISTLVISFEQLFF
uniref:Uncharacterized protein n=1 Tax=Lepeophtheirus salmonis TaxID=72036 RepID=A0A0K2TNL1_LEPSM